MGASSTMAANGRLHDCKGFILRLIRSPGLYFDQGWEASRLYWFSLFFVAVFSAKLLHIYSHLSSLPLKQFLVWGLTFFVQDVLCIVVAWGLTRHWHGKWARIMAALVVIPMSLIVSGMAAANISFYASTGAEIHWRQARTFHRDAASVKTLLSGLTGLLIVEILFIVVSWFATPFLFNWIGGVLRILSSSVTSVCCCCRRRKKPALDPEGYEPVVLDDYDEDKNDLESSPSMGIFQKMLQETNQSPLKLLLILLPTATVIILSCIRPSDPAYCFLSQTLILTPFSEPRAYNGNVLLDIPRLQGDYSWLGNRTALDTPPKFNWLPSRKLDGFRDWYTSPNASETYMHYNPAKDPLHISNLQGEVIEPLREVLHNGKVKIKHVFVLKLESTREDVFPLRKESYMHNRVRQTYSNGRIPDHVEKRLANLTRTAERLAGIPSGWDSEGTAPKPYGGIRAANAYTSSTFTLKSLTGTLCGVSPLVVDFNREYLHHIYQPCIPQILDALNPQSNGTNSTDDFTSWPWHSAFMQSITDSYDNQNYLTPVLGYKHSVTVDTIVQDRMENPSPDDEPVNFWGYPDNELRGYFRNAINKAEQDKERLFISHITGITHHPWNMPHNKFEEMSGPGWFKHNTKLNRYLNTIGFADRWLAEILEILEDTGIANETLLVVVGDHGISLPEDNGVTPNDNPHVSNFHVPLVFAHPHLPPIEISSAVTSKQILPTLLDLLKESSSLDDHSKHIVEDLLPMYEGQSMIRPLIPELNGVQDWQFTVMNTGGTWLSLRSAANPYRLVVPLVPDVEWRFTDVETDPSELHHLMAFDLLNLMELVRAKHGSEAVQWINDAAHVAQWWVSENWRRYEYTP